MTKDQISQGYPVVNGFPKYVTLNTSRLEYQTLNGMYRCPDGAWYLSAVYNRDRHLIVSHQNNWQLSSSKGKYLTPITEDEYRRFS